MTVADKISTLAGIKNAQRAALESHGLSPGDDWRDYAALIEGIETGGGGLPDGFLPDPAPASLNSMFSDWSWIRSVPLFDTSNVTNMYSMFQNCASLTAVPLFDTGRVTDMSYMFRDCASLATVPEFDTSNVTNASKMFSFCRSLQSVPSFDTQNMNNMDYMFEYCRSLTSVPLFNMLKVSRINSTFDGCEMLKKVHLENCESIRQTRRSFAGCQSLEEVTLPGLNVGIEIRDAKLSADAINALFDSLGTVSGKNVTVTGNPGSADCDPSIAEAKGWTVVR